MLRSYAITMHTPMGDKSGTLALDIAGAVISGTLEIFGKRHGVTGEALGDGSCLLRGNFTTLMSTFTYRGSGHIREDALELTLLSGSRTYRVTGTPLPNTEKEKPL